MCRIRYAYMARGVRNAIQCVVCSGGSSADSDLSACTNPRSRLTLIIINLIEYRMTRALNVA